MRKYIGQARIKELGHVTRFGLWKWGWASGVQDADTGLGTYRGPGCSACADRAAASLPGVLTLRRLLFKILTEFQVLTEYLRIQNQVENA